MKNSSRDMEQLQKRVNVLESQKLESDREITFIKEKLLAQKMMLDEMVAYSSKLEMQLENSTL